jgi:hypothetical protein
MRIAVEESRATAVQDVRECIVGAAAQNFCEVPPDV